MTLRDYKIDLEERFRKKWTSLSVEYHFKSIMSVLLDIPFSEVNMNLNLVFPLDKIEDYKVILERLSADEPLQYVIGETEFRNCRILCTPAALIPRPETEEIVDLVLAEIAEIQNPKVLDLCTGTGCIAISIAQERKDAIVTGIDNFDAVMQLAQKNKQLNAVDLDLVKANVLDKKQIKQFETNDFDIWISNPPYIPTSDKLKMDKNVLGFEPEEALFVPDNDPLLFYREIAKSASLGLKNKGYIFFEIHEDFGQETIDLLEGFEFSEISLYQDLQGKNRMISAQK